MLRNLFRIALLCVLCGPLYTLPLFSSNTPNRDTTTTRAANAAQIAAHMYDEDSFRNHMVHYTEKIRTLIADQVIAQDLAIEGLLYRLKSPRVLQLLQIEDIANHFTQIMQIVESAKPKMKETVLEDLRCALLVQLMVPIDVQMRKMIFSILDRVDRAIVYWLEQQQSPMHYFFHKSPLKITSGQPQQREIEEKLIFLFGVQKNMFEFLGEWTMQIHQFNRNAKSNEHYQWLVGLLSVSYKFIHDKKFEMDERNDYDRAVLLIKNFLEHIPGCISRVERLVYSAYVPNHFVRNWLHYAIAGIGVGIGGYYAHHHKQQIPIIANNMRSTLYTSFVQTPRDALCDAFPFLKPFIGQGMPEGPNNNADDEILLAAKAAAVSDAFATVISHMQGNEENLSEDQLKQSYRETVNEYFKSRGNTVIGDREISPDVVEANVNRLDRGFIAQLVNQCFTDDLSKSRYLAQPNLIGKGISLLNIFIQILNRGGEQAKADMLNLLHPAIKGFLDATAQKSDNIINELKKILKQNQVTFAITACVPICAALFTTGLIAKKLYRWWTYKEYGVMQRTLVSMAHLLNSYGDVHPNQMKIEHYGELLYLGHKLRKEKNKVPQGQRHQFVIDIERLEGVMSAQKKLYVIDLMYKSYGFLSRPA